MSRRSGTFFGPLHFSQQARAGLENSATGSIRINAGLDQMSRGAFGVCSGLQNPKSPRRQD